MNIFELFKIGGTKRSAIDSFILVGVITSVSVGLSIKSVNKIEIFPIIIFSIVLLTAFYILQVGIFTFCSWILGCIIIKKFKKSNCISDINEKVEYIKFRKIMQTIYNSDTYIISLRDILNLSIEVGLGRVKPDEAIQLLKELTKPL